MLAVGGYGVVSVATHVVGKQIARKIYSFLDGAREESAAIHRRLLPLIDALFVVANPIPVKHMLNTIGMEVGSPRLPLTEADDATRAQIEDVLSRYDVDLAG